MNRNKAKPIVLILIFIGAVVVFSMLMNKENKEQTTTMDSASLPVMQFVYGDMVLNELHGYTQEMDMLSMRDGLMPLNDSRQLDVKITTYGNEIDNLSYKIRSMDSERLLVEVEQSNLIVGEDVVSSKIQLPSLFEANVEYNMELTVTMDGKEVHYYTRIVQANDRNVDESLAFARQFHEYTFREDADTFIPTFMDPATGDATTLSYVDLSCTLRQITWADFTGVKLTEPVISIKEISPSYNVITLNYVMTNVNEEKEIEYYNVEEYYRLRKTETRMYVLNFERRMNQLFRSENNFFNGNAQLLLGIRDNDVEFLGSDSGDSVAFVQEGELWSYDIVNNKITQVFTFRSAEGINSRENWDQHDIKIVRVDEAGSISFIVYGYMNSGIHEGSVGMAVYYYDALAQTVEEELFIRSDKSYEVLKAELGKLMYVNEQKQLYFMLNHSVYKMDLTTFELVTLVENGTDNCFASSKSGRYFAWIDPQKVNSSEEIMLEDLKTGITYTIRSGNITYLRPITFIGEDFVYGVARRSEVAEDVFGELQFPLSAIEILNTSEDKQEVIKDYRPGIGKVGKIVVDENNIQVQIVKLSNGRYEEIGSDMIMNRETEPINGIKIGKAVTDIKQTQVSLKIKERTETNVPEIILPKHVVLEEDRTYALDVNTEDYFYVYVKGEVIKATKDVSEAVYIANENMGVVVDSDVKYIFKRARNTTQTALKNLTPNASDTGSSSVTKSISIILNREEVEVRVNELISAGKTPYEILSGTLKDEKVIELRGNTVEELLYFIDQSTPVFAKTSPNTAVLLVGYSANYIYYYDAASGQTKSVDYAGAEAMFEKGGRYFIAYVK